MTYPESSKAAPANTGLYSGCARAAKLRLHCGQKAFFDQGNIRDAADQAPTQTRHRAVEGLKRRRVREGSA
jgi:hypothetical protein